MCITFLPRRLCFHRCLSVHISVCPEDQMQTPQGMLGYGSGRYASHWNAFLLFNLLYCFRNLDQWLELIFRACSKELQFSKVFTTHTLSYSVILSNWSILLECMVHLSSFMRSHLLWATTFTLWNVIHHYYLFLGNVFGNIMKILVYWPIEMVFFLFLYDRMWSHVELFSEIYHKMAMVSIVTAMETWPPRKTCNERVKMWQHQEISTRPKPDKNSFEVQDAD